MFPMMSEALFGWDLAIQFQIVNKTAVDFELTETKIQTIWFRGVIQPIPPRKLMIKPEGQRSWRWWTMWTQQLLDTDTILKDAANKLYRVLSESDWSNAGYYEYEITETVDLT